MHELDRGLIILRPKQPFVDWVNSWTTEDGTVTFEEACTETDGILIPEFESEAEGMAYVRLHATELFEHTLHEWCDEPSLWPIQRDYKVFCEWIEVRLHSMVFDAAEPEKIDPGLN